jgi:hypothetical protein
MSTGKSGRKRWLQVPRAGFSQTTSKLGLHTQFICGIMSVQADESVLDDRGLRDTKKVLPLRSGQAPGGTSLFA